MSRTFSHQNPAINFILHRPFGFFVGMLMLTLLAPPAVASAANAEQRCQQAKLIASGKMNLCLKRQLGRSVVGKPSKSGLCEAKFAADIRKADLKAARAGSSCRWMVDEDGTEIDLDTGANGSASNVIIIFDGIASDLYNIDLCVEGSDSDVAQSNVVLIFDGAEGDTYNISTCS